jgi:hypothetical protein
VKLNHPTHTFTFLFAFLFTFSILLGLGMPIIFLFLSFVFSQFISLLKANKNNFYSNAENSVALVVGKEGKRGS